jgi:hypothetical protein
MTLSQIPAGARFRYRPDGWVWELLDKEGDGTVMVADGDGATFCAVRQPDTMESIVSGLRRFRPFRSSFLRF